MTAASHPGSRARTGPDTRPAKPRPLFANVVWSEWIKLYTVRSTYWTLAAAAAVMVAFGALLTAAYTRHHGSLSPGARTTFDPAAYSLSGFFLAQLAIGVLGVVIISSEYATGSIRSTLAAVPQRVIVLAAKATVFGIVALVTGIVSSFAAFLAGQAILSGIGMQTNISAPGAARSVIGAGLYLAVLGLLCLGLGIVIRHTAGAIAAVVGLVLILPVLVQGLPASWQAHIISYLPSTAGQAVIGRTKFAPSGHLLAPWTGFALLCGYALAALLISAVLLGRRDA